MAYIVNTKIENQTNGYLLDAKNVKGTFAVVADVTERDALPTATRVTGSLCYVTGTTSSPVNKFYQYNGSAWVELIAATQIDGLLALLDCVEIVSD